MAIQTAGQKTAKVTKVKIENAAGFQLPAYTEDHLRKALDFLPIEHQRGIEKVKLVDFINDPRLKNLTVPIKGDLPGLYPSETGKSGRVDRDVDGSSVAADRRLCKEVDGEELVQR
jgi:hypothetical protein